VLDDDSSAHFVSINYFDNNSFEHFVSMKFFVLTRSEKEARLCVDRLISPNADSVFNGLFCPCFQAYSNS